MRTILLGCIAVMLGGTAGFVVEDRVRRDERASCEVQLGQIREHLQHLTWRARWQEERLRGLLGLGVAPEDAGP